MAVTWAAIVFHWLTIVGTDENEGATPASAIDRCKGRWWHKNHKQIRFRPESNGNTITLRTQFTTRFTLERFWTFYSGI
ncbi:unnamed protein product [Alternaria alternata]